MRFVFISTMSGYPCETMAGIVRVDYGWKRKGFFTAHWADAP